MKLAKNYTFFIKNVLPKINESRKSETEAFNILNDLDLDNNDNIESIIEDFKDIDKTKNLILLPSIAYFYSQNVDLSSLKQIFSKIPVLIDRKLVNIQYTKRGIKLNNILYTDWLKFSEKIDAISSAANYKKLQKLKKKNQSKELDSDNSDTDNEIDKPIWEGNGIKIYDGTDVGKCIRLGKGRSFCISQPANTTYQSYRDTKTSTFYFIFDENQKDNPLNVVVFDNTKFGVELTDEMNNTGTIYKYGTNVKSYIDYLKSKNVPVDSLLINKPKSDKEIQEDKLLNKENKDLKWFINLNAEYKSKYIGRGHLLSNEQFDYLYENNLWDLIKQYVNIGHEIPKHQIELLENKPNLLKSHIRTLYQRLERDDEYNPISKIIKYFNEYGYLEGEGEREYPNGKTNGYYKTIANPTYDKLKKYNIDTSVACRNGHTDILKLLLENGERVDETDINFAAANDHTKIFKFLINRFDYNNDEIIVVVSSNGNLELVELLLKRKLYNEETLNESLLDASSFGHNEIVELFIKYGADVTTKNNEAILESTMGGHTKVVKTLLENGADPTTKKNTPIITASFYGYTEIAKLLLDYGADPTTQNNKAINFAKSKGHNDIIELFKKHLSKLDKKEELKETKKSYTKKILSFKDYLDKLN